MKSNELKCGYELLSGTKISREDFTPHADLYLVSCHVVRGVEQSETCAERANFSQQSMCSDDVWSNFGKFPAQNYAR